MINKFKKLKQLINSPNLEFLMEAHNGLSAKIVEETGFSGIWASSLTISASLGVRDNNEASWTQIIDVAEFMSDATTIPILLDGDTGYGNFNNARRLVKKLEQIGIAGVCIEDKQFPKTNSFINGNKQELADIDEFCGKIKAMKDSQQNKDFVIVARIEAFIAGWGLKEAIRRANAYRKAGADAILVHSKKTDASEIKSFMENWKNQCPVLIVPTKYYSTPIELFEKIKISTVIWANHNLRSAITAMTDTSRRIFEEKSLKNIEDNIATVSDIFRIQGAEELKRAEKKYLPTEGKEFNAIILAAAQGDKLGELTKEVPKALISAGRKPIILNQIDNFNSMGIKDITIVRGFAKEKILFPNIKTVDNDNFASTTELYSLFLAKDEIKGNTIVSYGDIVYKNHVLNDLLNDAHDITIVVDADNKIDSGDYCECVKTDIPYSQSILATEVKLKNISSSLKFKESQGEFIGLFKMSERGSKAVRRSLKKLYSQKNFNKLRMKDLFRDILKTNSISVIFIKGSWLDVNTVADLQKSYKF